VRRIEIRRVTEEEARGAVKLMAELDLIHSALSVRNLWVVLEGESVVGVANLEPCADGFFLSSLGVADTHRNMGLARQLIESMLKGVDADVYAYTVIPGFFKKLGFAEVSAPKGLPPKEMFGCERCDPGICKCMVRRRDDTGVS